MVLRHRACVRSIGASTSRNGDPVEARPVDLMSRLKHGVVEEIRRRPRIHDLKHTFGRRLRAAGVPEETPKVLPGHKNGDISTHYSAAELRELIEAVQKIDASRETPMITVLRPVECLANVLQKNKGPARAAPKCVKSGL